MSLNAISGPSGNNINSLGSALSVAHTPAVTQSPAANSTAASSNPSFIRSEASATVLTGAHGAALPNRTRRTDWSSDITQWAHAELIHQHVGSIPDRHAFSS